MKIILKYKFYIFGILILAGIGYFALTFKISQAPSLKAVITTDSSETPTPTTTPNNPVAYGVTVTQTGGINSQVTTVLVVDLTSEPYTSLNPSENYMSVSFKRAGDLLPFGGEPSWVATNNSMWVYCKDGYVVTNAASPTDNPLDTYFIGVPEYGPAMKVLDKPNNTIDYRCERQ